ncbi:MAG TPA: DUF5362 family protein [Chitinophagaceae bacterium]|nr:DUF5362 family protein [Chitinophagaceae bacterium]
MEQQGSTIFGLTVDQTGKAHLAEAARWARFLAIVGFVVCALVVLIGIFFSSFIGVLSNRYGGDSAYGDVSVTPGLGAVMAVYYIIIALIYFFPCLFLFRFATKMKVALASNDQETLNTSFQNLKATFRYMGIVTIVMLVFFLLAFLVGFLGVLTAGSM